MSNLRQAAQQALEALKLIDDAMPFPVAKLAIKNLRAALAEPEQEPISLNNGRLTQYPDGSIGVGKPAEPEQELGQALKQAIERINELEALNGDLYNALKQAQGMLKLTPNALLVITGAMNRWRRVNEAG